jgi:PleD family two-component response regulator
VEAAVSAAVLDIAGDTPATTAMMAHPMLGMSLQLKPHMRFPKKILLIDREPGVTRLIRRALERTGKYWIKEEHDSQFALHSARWFQPDLILVDTMTASADREVLAKQIQTDAMLQQTPLVCLSSLKSESQIASGGILSGYSFFAAPVRVDEVLRGVEQLLFGKD